MRRHAMAIMAAGLTLASGFALCEEQKLAVVDMGRVIESHPKEKANRAVMDKLLDEFRGEVGKMQKEKDRKSEELDKMRKDIGSPALSKDARDKALKEAEEKFGELREFDRKSRETLSQRERQISDQKRRMREELVSSIRGVVKTYAEKRGLQVVLDSSGLALNGVETVVYGGGALDVTDEILKLTEKKN